MENYFFVFLNLAKVTQQVAIFGCNQVRKNTHLAINYLSVVATILNHYQMGLKNYESKCKFW